MGGELSPDALRASRPLLYGRWDDAAREHAMLGVCERYQAAREGYAAGITLDPPTTRAALKNLAAPVLLHAGTLDPLVTPTMVQQAAALLPEATAFVHEAAAHFPWVDDPTGFATAIGSFLETASRAA